MEESSQAQVAKAGAKKALAFYFVVALDFL